MTAGHVAIAVVGAALVGCSDPTNTPASQLNLDRPVDVTFACYGGLRITNGAAGTPSDPITTSAQPIRACETRSQPRVAGQPLPAEFGQEDLTAIGGAQLPGVSWFGFVLESAAGTVAIAQFSTKPPTSYTAGDPEFGVLDADRLTPGKNSISVGEDPVAIVTDKVGCHAITANAGSRDLSVLDISTALDDDPAIKVDRLEVKNALGQRVRGRPAAMVAEPAGGQVGVMCPAQPRGLLYIAYPSCHLVAAVDAGSGRIVRSIRYDAAGVPSIVMNGDINPDECGGNGELPGGPRPVTLDLEVDERTASRRLVIGSNNSGSFAVVELDLDSLPVSVSQIALENTTGDPGFGITQLALSPSIGIGGDKGMIDDSSPDYQFVYAITTDHTVRVADVRTLNRECDTQIDPRFLRDVRDAVTLGCMPIGDPARPRRAGARGPGIEVGIPLSIDIVKSEPIPDDSRLPGLPAKLIGYFGIITTAGGNSFVLNIDDDDYPDLFDVGSPLRVPIDNAISHRLRDSISDRGDLSDATVEDPNDPTKKVVVPLCNFNGPLNEQGVPSGGPRAANIPVRNVPAGNLAPEKLTTLPYFRQDKCVGNDEPAGKAITELSYSAAEAVRDHEFPDLHALASDETWTLTWEGSLSLDRADTAVDGPGVRESQISVDEAGMRIRDQTRPFCDAGVEPFDIVQLRGCDPSVGDLDCPTGYRCFVHPQSQVQGLGACLLDDEADRLADACKDFLTSMRRYTVKTAESGVLELAPRRHELKTTPLDGCTTSEQCEMLADYAIRATSAQHPVDDHTPADSRTWACHADSTRAPIPPNSKRCVMKCDTTADCETGTVCQGAVPGQPMSGFCMEGVTPPQACVNAPQRYELRAGEAFTVVGSRSGFLHATKADPDGKCVRSPTASGYLVGRVPLDPPACDPTADPLTGRLPDKTFDANPCSTTVSTTDVVPNYNPGSCVLGSPATQLVDRADAPAIVFRNPGMNLTIVDPYYPGDQSCILDRRGNLGKVPHVFPGYQLAFRQTAGFSPMALPIQSSFPVKVVRGPTNSIWVIDEGDFLSTSVGLPSTRGKVFRLEAHALGIINVLQ